MSLMLRLKNSSHNTVRLFDLPKFVQISKSFDHSLVLIANTAECVHLSHFVFVTLNLRPDPHHHHASGKQQSQMHFPKRGYKKMYSLV